ncbi:tripartite tricarboxylate transporter TctB family protein [Marinobacter nanhaiticus D15-8W]|uniref:Tripartite tricarboxylate transporter TctB family protein n=2 Tax=Marinobacter TaxID=2742 RepID=N6W738_9GAMM|nr:tripartite tricarboxylate transporter TctB family protein [Marinobacter nanhaiticus D15-8W]
MSTKRFALDGEFYVPAVLAIITVVYLISAIQLGPPMKDGNMTESFFPILTSVVMLIALVCAMVQALGRISSNGSDEEATAEASRTSKRYAGISLGAIGVVLLTTGYLLAFDLIGYFVSTFFYVLLLHGLFSGSIKKNWLMKLVATLLITAAGYLLFEVFFQVRLPTFWSQ